MTKEEKLIVTAYTGILMTNWSEFHGFAEERLKRPIFSHEFASIKLWDELKQSVEKDFLKICIEDEVNKEV